MDEMEQITIVGLQCQVEHTYALGILRGNNLRRLLLIPRADTFDFKLLFTNGEIPPQVSLSEDSKFYKASEWRTASVVVDGITELYSNEWPIRVYNAMQIIAKQIARELVNEWWAGYIIHSYSQGFGRMETHELLYEPMYDPNSGLRFDAMYNVNNNTLKLTATYCLLK